MVIVMMMVAEVVNNSAHRHCLIFTAEHLM
jgi:hypothetical protein